MGMGKRVRQDKTDYGWSSVLTHPLTKIAEKE